MTSPLVEASRNIKAELKSKFPATKFSVRSHSYAGGNSIHVAWANGPTAEQVSNITAKYEEGSFDGMTDSYVPHGDSQREAFQRIRGSAKYVFVKRRAV